MIWRMIRRPVIRYRRADWQVEPVERDGKRQWQVTFKGQPAPKLWRSSRRARMWADDAPAAQVFAASVLRQEVAGSVRPAAGAETPSLSGRGRQ
jgi:hypothetical protein